MECNDGGGGGGGYATAAKGKMHELVPHLRFPPGYHFVPSEEELIDVYLRAKIEGRKLPLDVVNNVDLLHWEPGKLVEAYKAYGENKWYFFTKREKSSSNKKNEPSRKLLVAGVEATWKATGSLTTIHRTGKDGKRLEEVIGTKRILIYYSKKGGDDGKWSMHEYVMADKPKMDQYVLCTIQRKQHWDKAGEEVDSGNKRKREDTNMEPKTTTRRKKTTTSQAQESQQQQQETTSDGSSEPLVHEQGHQTFHEEQPLSFDATSLSAVIPQGYPGVNHQLDVSTQMYAGYAHMAPNFQLRDMVQVYKQDPVMFYNQGQQLLGYTDHQLISPISSGEHAAQHQFFQQGNGSVFRELEPLPYPGPLENANLYSNSIYKMSNGTSTLVQQTDDDFLKFTDVHDDLAVGSQLGSGYGVSVGTSEGRNIQASAICQDGLQRRCTEQRHDSDGQVCCVAFCGVCR